MSTMDINGQQSAVLHASVMPFLDALASLKPVVSLSDWLTDQTQIAEITTESISVGIEIVSISLRVSCPLNFALWGFTLPLVNMWHVSQILTSQGDTKEVVHSLHLPCGIWRNGKFAVDQRGKAACQSAHIMWKWWFWEQWHNMPPS